MLIPLEALLTGVGSVRPIRTKDFKQASSERTFPLARLRGLSLMLKGARLVANCSQQEFQEEIDKLTDPRNPDVPKVVFEQPVGASHKMGYKHSGPWTPEIQDALQPFPLQCSRQYPLNLRQLKLTANDDEVKVLRVFQQGGSSGSSSSSSANTVSPTVQSSSVSNVPGAEQSFSEPVAMQSSSEPVAEFTLVSVNVFLFISALDAFEELLLAMLKVRVEGSTKLSKHQGEKACGYHSNGKPVRINPDSHRPSVIEPEIFDSSSPSQKEKQGMLVKAQKRE